MIIYGHRHQGGYEIPDWAGRLPSLYWFIRVEGRDKSKQRRYYRLVEKEKLRLAELGIDQDLINSVCRYLAGLHPSAGNRMSLILTRPKPQMSFNFSNNDAD